MPWWAFLYLGAFVLLGIGGITDDLSKPNKAFHVVGGILTTVFGVLFVSGYYYEGVRELIYSFILPMLVIGFIFELISAKRDLSEMDYDLSETEERWVKFLSMVGVNLITVPAYAFGIMVFLNGEGV